jgi:hypothetical protein
MNKHEFVVNGLKLRVINPTSEIKLESSKYYFKALQEAMTNDYPLSVELEKILTDRKIYNPESEEKRAIELRKNIRDLEIKLRRGIVDNRKMTKEEGRDLALLIRKERNKLRDLGSTINGFMNNTAESYANNERMQYLMYACTVYAENGQKYWKTYNDFKSDSSSPVYQQSAEEFLSLITGLDKDYEVKYYENQWLIKMGFMNNKLQLIDNKGRLIDENNRLIDENGYFVDENGNKIDQYGNMVDDQGNLLVEDSWSLNNS